MGRSGFALDKRGDCCVLLRYLRDQRGSPNPTQMGAATGAQAAGDAAPSGLPPRDLSAPRRAARRT